MTRSSAPAETTTTSAPSESRQFGFLKAVDTERRTLTFDLAEFYSGADAKRAAAEDGNPDDAGDYYIRNRNSRLRTLPYAANVIVHGGACFPESCPTPLAYDLSALVRRVRDEQDVRVWLTLRDGVVVDIENPYFP